jgi:hypothetical protein
MQDLASFPSQGQQPFVVLTSNGASHATPNAHKLLDKPRNCLGSHPGAGRDRCVNGSPRRLRKHEITSRTRDMPLQETRQGGPGSARGCRSNLAHNRKQRWQVVVGCFRHPRGISSSAPAWRYFRLRQRQHRCLRLSAAWETCSRLVCTRNRPVSPFTVSTKRQPCSCCMRTARLVCF